jgi:hypothetical protein
VLALSAIKAEIEEGESPLMRQVFAFLFPFGPGWNSGMPVITRVSTRVVLMQS